MRKNVSLSEYNAKADWDKMKTKYDSISGAIKALDKLRDYLIEANCSIDDLINAHKSIKQNGKNNNSR